MSPGGSHRPIPTATNGKRGDQRASSSHASVASKRQRGGDKAGRGDQAERCGRREREEQADDAERTEAGADEVECVDTADLVREAREGEPDRAAAEEERQDEEEIG